MTAGSYALAGGGGDASGQGMAGAGGGAESGGTMSAPDLAAVDSGAFGGRGGAGEAGGAAGGDAAAYASTSSSDTGQTFSGATAVGGDGGDATTGAGGAAGAAIAASAIALGGGAAVALVVARGGTAGSGARDGEAGGSVFGVLAFASGIGSASASAMVTGGGGGDSLGGDGGGGASVALINAVSGMTDGGALTLAQTVIGGFGGGAASADANAGDGGGAVSQLTLDDTRSATQSASLDVQIEVEGGLGGTNGTPGAHGGQGGDATALGNVTGIAGGSLFEEVDAIGGDGGGRRHDDLGGDATAFGKAKGGDVTIFVVAVGGQGSGPAGDGTARDAGVANASAIAIGESGSAFVSASANNPFGVITRLASLVQAPVDGKSQFAVFDALGGDQPALTGGLQGEAFALGLPDAAAVHAVTAMNDKIAAAFHDAKALLIGDAGGAHSSAADGTAQTVTSDIDASIGIDRLPSPGALILGLYSGHAVGAENSGSVEIEVFADSQLLLDKTFGSTAAANQFFHDHVIDLGDVTTLAGADHLLDLDIKLTTVSDTASAGYEASILVGNQRGSGSPGPAWADGNQSASIDHLPAASAASHEAYPFNMVAARNFVNPLAEEGHGPIHPTFDELVTTCHIC